LTFNDTDNSSTLEYPLNEVACKIAGEIVFSDNVGKAMRIWRMRFGISQTELALHMGISPSLISDYESGRRKSPGATMIRKFVRALIEIDRLRGMPVLSRMLKCEYHYLNSQNPIIEHEEYVEPLSAEEFCKAIGAKVVTIEEVKGKRILGYTVADSLKFLLESPPYIRAKLYGLTNERAIIFTNVNDSGALLIALKFSIEELGGLRPSLVVLHGIRGISELGLLLAKKEYLPLAIVEAVTLRELLSRLRLTRSCLSKVERRGIVSTETND